MAVRSLGMAKLLMFSLFSTGIIFPSTSSIQLEISSETDTGSWTTFYDTVFPFVIDGQHFIYGQSKDSSDWFIRELLPNGKMGRETSSGTWLFYYENQFPLSVAGKHFIFAHSSKYNYWFIQELLSGGEMGSETDSGYWSRFYHTNFPFSINGRQFLYGHSTKDFYWFILEVLPGGTIGSETSTGKWERDYSLQFPFKFNSEYFLYGESRSGNYWFIQELLPDGIMGSETQHGSLAQYYPVQFPFSVHGQQFLYGSNPSNNMWFMKKLSPWGIKEIRVKQSNLIRHYSFGFSLGDRSFLFSQSSSHTNPNWSIEEVVLCAGKMSKIRPFAEFKVVSWNMQGATSLRESKWTSTVAREMKKPNVLSIDVLALQDSGTLPPTAVTIARQSPVTRIDPLDVNNMVVTQNIWHLGTLDKPKDVYIYNVKFGRGKNNNHSMAIVSSRKADSFVIGGPFNEASRPVIGIRYKNSYFFNIHGGSHGKNEAPDSVKGIEEFMSEQLRHEPDATWVILSDYNRSPKYIGLSEPPANVDRDFAIHSTHSVGRDQTLDYAVVGTGFETQVLLVPITSIRSLLGNATALSLTLREQPVRGCSK